MLYFTPINCTAGKMPDSVERCRDWYWNEVYKINVQGFNFPVTVLRPMPFDEGTSSGLFNAHVADDCYSIIYLLDMHYDTLRRSSGVGSIVMADTRSQLVSVLLQSGFLQDVPADMEPANSDLPF